MDPTPITTLGRGEDHVAYLVDGSLVVRFAQGHDAREQVEREARLLALVAELVEVAVPRPACVMPDLGGLVYERLPGVPLIELSERERAAEAVGHELGTVLRALHGVDPEQIRDLVGVDRDPLDAWQQEAASLYHDFAANIPSAFTPAIASFFRSLPPERGSEHHEEPRRPGVGLLGVEALLERERVRRRAMRVEVLEPLLCLVDRRDVPSGNPPQGEVRRREALEPLAPAAEVLDVPAAVGELEERVDRLPDRHVDDDLVVVEDTDRDRVAGVVLQPPDEAGRRLGQRIDGLERSDELG